MKDFKLSDASLEKNFCSFLKKSLTKIYLIISKAVSSNFCSSSGTGTSTTKATTKATTTKATTKATTTKATTKAPSTTGGPGGSGEGGDGDDDYYD